MASKKVAPYCMLGVKCKTTKLLDNPSICKHCSIRCCSLCACGTRRYVKCQSCFDKIQEQGARIKEEKISKFTSNGLGNTPTNLFLSPKSHLCSSMKKDSARERNSSVNCPVVESDKMAPEMDTGGGQNIQNSKDTNSIHKNKEVKH